MTTAKKSSNPLPPIPAQRYFTQEELCRLVDISVAEFIAWQKEQGMPIGYGGQRYTRQDIIKIRQIRRAFNTYQDSFTHNQTDQYGHPAIDANETKQRLTNILNQLESTLAKP